MSFHLEYRRLNAFHRRPFLSFSSFIMATLVGLVSSFTFSTAYDMLRAALSGERQMVSGVWQGQWQGVPAVTIKLEQNGDELRGTASFYRVKARPEGPETLGESPEIPLVNPRFDGERLLFELDAKDEIHPTIFVEMEMRFENEDEAQLRCKRRASEEVSEDKEPAIRMKRERSF